MEDRLLSGVEAAQLLGTTKGNLAFLRCRGKGPKFVKLGRSVRYKMSDLQDYIRSLQ